MRTKVIKPGKSLFVVAGCLFLAVFIYFGYTLVSTLIQYQRSERAYDELQNALTVAKAAETVSDSDPVPIKVDFGSLQKTNPDIVGWLYCEGTVINYPVVQGKDNSYYLKHLYNGTKNASGTLFIDYRNGKGFSDENTVVYGHHMKNGSMFASLVNYRSQSYYDKHPVLYFLTPSNNYRIELFSGYICGSTSSAFERQIKPETNFTSHLVSATKKSDFKSSISVTSVDRIVTLSTCTYEYENARYVVHGKIVLLK